MGCGKRPNTDGRLPLQTKSPQKKRFPKVFKLAVDQITDEAVKKMVLGVIFSPFDPNAVDYSKCVKDQLPSKKSSDHASAIHTNYQPSLHYLRSKRWKQLIGEEKAEKEKQKLIKKK